MEAEGLDIQEDERGEIERVLAPESGVQLERRGAREYLLLLTLPNGEEVTVVLESQSRIAAFVD